MAFTAIDQLLKFKFVLRTFDKKNRYSLTEASVHTLFVLSELTKENGATIDEVQKVLIENFHFYNRRIVEGHLAKLLKQNLVEKKCIRYRLTKEGSDALQSLDKALSPAKLKWVK